MRKWIARLVFCLAYWRGRTPWDTNVTPPELVKTIEGARALPPGRALDLGCGTGTNVIYLAKHGWEAVGVDFVAKPLEKARKKAQAAGVAARFFKGDVTRLDRVAGLSGVFDLVVDIGCFHSLAPEGQARYAASLVERLRPGATYLLYAWGPTSGGAARGGISRAQIEALLAPHLKLTHIEHGTERYRRPAAWYWLEYKA